MKKLLVKLSIISLIFSCSCDNDIAGGNKDNGDGNNTGTEETSLVTSDDIELSYWVDCDMGGYHRRGYWYKYGDYASERVPHDGFITNGVKMLVETYKANLLYVFYHRQFEIDAAKEVLLRWKEAAKDYNVKLVPTVLLQDYSNYSVPAESNMNFTDEELIEFAKWSQENFGEEFGIFDVYTRQAAGSLQAAQLDKLKAAIGNNLVFVGFQPGVRLSDHFKRAVEDTWTAECQGNTNELWSNPLNGQLVGKKLLDQWVSDRVRNESRPITWDLIPVAWDYEETTAKDKYGYVCPGDNALYNDPPIPGRLKLSKDAIFAQYPNTWKNEKLAGLSCDLTILQANSSGCTKDKEDFYQAIRIGKVYTGYFASAMDEIAEIYEEVYNEVKTALGK